jgi:hypothetical protein
MQADTIDTFGSDAVIVKEWKPTEKQQQVISMPDSIFEGLGGGAAGGGKTDLGLMIPPIRQFTEHPKFKALILRRTYADLEKEIIPRQYEWYAPMGATYNDTKKVWIFPAGARIQNGHAEREQDVRKYDSAEYNYIDWDESTHFTEFQYLYLSISRCRSSSPDLPAFVRAFTNPGNVGHSFFKKRFVDPSPRGRKIIVDRVTKQKRMYIPFLGRDNPFLLLNDPQYLTRLEGLPEIEKKAKLFGDWNSYEGQVFSEYRVLHLPDEPANAVHVIPIFIVPDWWPRILCIDWGYAANTFAIWAAISPSGRCYIYRTYSVNKTTIKIWAPEIVRLTGTEEIADLFVCHSAGQHRGEEKTIQEQINDAFDGRYTVNLAPKDRIGGKNLIHEYLRWRQIPKIKTPETGYDHEFAAKILRNYGEDKYNEYMMIFVEQEDETNIPKLQICQTTPEGIDNNELIDVIPSCIPAEHNPEDVAEFPGDDAYDTLRMVVQAAHRYIDTASERFIHLQRLQKIINGVTRESVNGVIPKISAEVQTAFYRNMEKYEAEINQSYSVRRRSPRRGH